MIESGADHSDRYCLFDCCGRTFAVPALAVRSVTPAMELSSLAISHSCLAGLATVHKEIVPVFDLNEFVGNHSTAGSQMLVLNSDSGAWAILIDQVLGLESIEVSFTGTRSDSCQWNAVNVASASFLEQFVSVLDPEMLFELLRVELNSFWIGLDSEQESGTTNSNPAVFSGT